jgi:hypothetical protein
VNPKAAVSAGASKRPFIVDMEAALLQRNADLSKGARHLYATMRALADGKTGHLAINGNPLDWMYIARQAEIGRKKWQACLRELRFARLVRVERERVMQFTGGRKRVVFGRALYVAPRQPVTGENIKNQPNLLKSLSCTVQERTPRITQKHPSGGTAVSDGLSDFEATKSKRVKTNHHHLGNSDDDRDFIGPNHFETIQDQAKEILVGQGELPEFIDEALRFIDERSQQHQTVPATANYYVKSFEVLKHNSNEMGDLWEKVNRGKALREKFMPDFDSSKFSGEPDEMLTEMIRKSIAATPDNAHALSTFEKFWESYPRKIDRDEAKKLWMGMSAIEQSCAVDSMPVWAESEDWSETKYVPAPAKFLRNRRWESKPIAKKPKGENACDLARRLEREYDAQQRIQKTREK